MKIKLLTLFLTITTLPFFIQADIKKAHLTTAQQEQLKQLEDVRDQTKCYLKLFTMGLNDLCDYPETAGEIGWNDVSHSTQWQDCLFWKFYLTLWNNCINRFDGIKAQIEVETYFDLLCTEKIETLNLLSGNIWEEDIWEIQENLMQTIQLIHDAIKEKGKKNPEQQQQYQTILSLISDHIIECTNIHKFKTCTAEEIAEILIDEDSYELIHYFYLTTRIMPNLLAKINKEIAKLEMQA